MNQRVNTHELAGGVDQIDVDTLFQPDQALDAMRDAKRYTRSGQQSVMNKFAKTLEIIAEELNLRDAALRKAYSQLNDARAHDEFVATAVATVKALKGGSFEVSRPMGDAPKRGWFR